MTAAVDPRFQPVVAAVEVCGRTGARDFEIGYLDDDPDAPRWWAAVTYRGAKVTVEDHESPAAAADALVARILEGAWCVRCNHRITLDPRRPPARAMNRWCVWRYIGGFWRGCGR